MDLGKAQDIAYNTNRMAGSLSRWSAFHVPAPNLINMSRLFSETTAFLVGAAEGPGFAASRDTCYVGPNTWGYQYDANSVSFILTNRRAERSISVRMEVQQLPI